MTAGYGRRGPLRGPLSIDRGPLRGPLSIDAGEAHLDTDDPLEDVWGALATVYDPELCLDVVSLGLVYDVHREGDRVVVEMTLTTPGCPASESLPVIAESAVQQAVGPEAGVDIRIVWDPPWSPAMMSEDAAGALGFRTR